MSDFSTVNPTSGLKIKDYNYATKNEIKDALTSLQESASYLRKTEVTERCEMLRRWANQLREAKLSLAQKMALEMGKPIQEGLAEVEKCAGTCEYFALKSAEWLLPEVANHDSLEVRVLKEPLGILLAIMPWNFPLWQVMRVAVPALAVGNVVLLKHAEITAGVSLLLEEVLDLKDHPKILRQIFLSHSQLEEVVADPRIKALSFTGSTAGGKRVASLAGSFAKKVVLELGGSDPYVVLQDADVASAAKCCAQARLINNGQSCVAAKRFFVHEKIFPEFIGLLQMEMQKFMQGDPQVIATQLGPLAAKRFQRQLQAQVNTIVNAGGQVIMGGQSPQGAGAFYPPSLLQMPASDALWSTELFGPVACVWQFQSEIEAVARANNSSFGLGAAIFSQDQRRAKHIADELECGLVSINQAVRSDPRWPFGGQKESGFGRELSHNGLMEFVNVKSVLNQL